MSKSQNLCIVLGCKGIRTVTVQSRWCHKHLQEQPFPITPPDQPEDAALSQKLRDVVEGWTDTQLSDEAIADLMQLFHAQERKKVQNARADEVLKAINPPKKYEIFREDSCEHDEYLPDRLADLRALQTTQPPAADTTKQGEGE